MVHSDILKVELDERKRRLHVEIDEEVVSTHVPTLRNEWVVLLERYGDKDWSALYLDLRNCRMVDSMGLNWIYAESLRIKQTGKEFVIRISSPAINRVMEFAGLDKVVTLKYRRRKQTR